MSKPQRKSQRQAVSKQELGELLTQQTSVILQAVDEGFAAQDKRIEERFVVQNIALSGAMDKRLAKLEELFMQKLNGLTTTLEKFLRRMTDIEQEFTFMKHDVKRIKAVIRAKLGVAID